MDDRTFFEWYQEQLVCVFGDCGDLIFLFSRFTSFRNYNREWAQKCLDFSYRVLKCNICEFFWDNPDNIKILNELACNNPIDVHNVTWDTYQLELTEWGEKFLLECGVNDETTEFSPLLKERLTELFEENGVGFDKSNFIPVQF